MINKICIIFYLITLLSCIKNEQAGLAFNEFHFSAYNDSASIECIITPDSIIVSEIIFREIGHYGMLEFGPTFYTYSVKDKLIWNKLKALINCILTDTCTPNIFKITHSHSNKIEILQNDSLVKKLYYYQVQDEKRILTDIQLIIFEAITNNSKITIDPRHHLFDLSMLKIIDSIKIENISIEENPTLKAKYISRKDRNEYTIIVGNNPIEEIRKEFSNCKIIIPFYLDQTHVKFNPKLQINLYKKGLVSYTFLTDYKTLSFNSVQWLELSEKLVSMLKQ